MEALDALHREALLVGSRGILAAAIRMMEQGSV